MSEREQMERAVAADPDDDTPRLAYADWLDERAAPVKCGVCGGSGYKPPEPPEVRERILPGGRVERYAELPPFDFRRPPACPTCGGAGSVPDALAARAEFVRVEVELARLESVRCHQPGAEFGDGCNDTLCPRCGPQYLLWRREDELFALLPAEQMRFREVDLFTDRSRWHRGFPHTAECVGYFWEQFGDELLARYPIKRVEFADDSPQARYIGDNLRFREATYQVAGKVVTVPIRDLVAHRRNRFSLGVLRAILSARWPQIPEDGWVVAGADEIGYGFHLPPTLGPGEYHVELHDGRPGG
jgi:uncharacterized protein (TIGR02996 family)